MAAEFDSCLFVDKPAYSSVLLALESVDLEMLTSIATYDQISQAIKPGVFNYHNLESFFMAIIKPKSILKNGERLILKLDELSSNGFPTEQSFYLTLNKEISRKWLSNPTLKSVSPEENFLIIFQGIPVMVKVLDKTIHFVASSATVDAKIRLKHYFSCIIDDIPSLPNTQMLNLSQAIMEKPFSFDIFAVVRHVFKKPGLTQIGSAHGMYAIIDPSIRETNQSERYSRGCIVHIFATSLNVFPEIQVGDVLKFEGISTQKRLSNKKEVEFIAKEGTHFIVFPNGFNWETPTSTTDYFKITESDFVMVNELKKWWRDNNSMPNTPKSAQKPSHPQKVETARQNKGRPSQNTFSHEEHVENEQSPNLKSCEMNDLSTQCQNDEQRLSSTNQSVLHQHLKNLTNRFSSFPLKEQGRVIDEIARVTETAIDNTSTSSRHSSLNSDTAGQKRRSLNFSNSFNPQTSKKARKMSTSANETQEDSGFLRLNESFNLSQFFTDFESSGSCSSFFISPSRIVASSPK